MFKQRYRVFSSTYSETASSYNLEKSDKLILPQNALTTLTNCKNIQFPVLLKISCWDLSITQIISEHISYVVDFSAPTGLIYMSNWLVSKLGIEGNGKSIVELSILTAKQLQFQCPIAQSIILQPQTINIYNDMLNIGNGNNGQSSNMPIMIDNLQKYITEYYSTLMVDDIIAYCDVNDENSYQLKVIKIGAKSGQPKRVRIGSKLKMFSVMFVEPPAIGHKVKEQKENDGKLKDNDVLNISESDEEWEIISVEQIKNPILLQDLENNSYFNIDIKEDMGNENNNQRSWVCPKCSKSNEIEHKFCPKCGTSKKANVQSNVNGFLLQKLEVLNPGTYEPCEERQSGWILKNISGTFLSMNACLVKNDGDTDIKVKYEKNIEIRLANNEQMFVLMEVIAPAIPAQYHAFFRLVDVGSDEDICSAQALKLPIVVRKVYSDKKEKSIKNLIHMGFPERKRVIEVLKKWNWDECKAVNFLVTR